MSRTAVSEGKALFSTSELSKWLGLSQSTVRRWIDLGEIKGFRAGRNYKIPTREVIRVMERHDMALPEELKKLKLKLEDRPEGAFDHEGHRGSIFEQLVIVDEIQDPAIICRKDAILAANQAFAEFAGYSQVDLIGRDIAELTDESLWDKLMDYVQRRLARPSKVPSEFVAHAKMGKLGKKKLTIRVASVGKTKNLFLLIIRATGVPKVS